MATTTAVAAATTLVFVRHGKTVWNTESILQGHLDGPGCQLTDVGRREARQLGRAFARDATCARFDAVYASDLGRAMTTARLCLKEMPLMGGGKDDCGGDGYDGDGPAGRAADAVDRLIRREPRLRERFLGSLQGKPYAAREFHEAEGVEPEEALCARALAAIRDICAAHPGQTVLCVAHGGTISMLMQTFLGLTGRGGTFRIKNTSVSIVLATAALAAGANSTPTLSFVVESMGCTSHLRTIEGKEH